MEKTLEDADCARQEVGVSQSTIGRILRGEVNPRSGNPHRLARALGMSLKALARMAEDAEIQATPAIVSERVGGDAMRLIEEIDHALLQALACREDRKRGEQAVDSLPREENDAIKRLQELVRGEGNRRLTP